jgi:hypothetical protein
MAHPADERTTVNVKGVSVSAWTKGKAAADLAGETMGAWLSRTIERAVSRGDGRVEFPDLPAAHPVAFTPPNGRPGPDAGAALDRLAPVLAGMNGKLNRQAAASVSRLIDSFARDAQGLPPRPAPKRKASGKAIADFGLTVPRIGTNGTHPA